MAAPAKHSATRRRCEEQLAALAALPPDTRVTGIRPRGEDQSRLDIRAGKARFGPIHAADRDALALSVGDELSPDARDRLADALAREAARADALSLLRTRSRSRRDLLHRLALKGHDREHASLALDRLADVGLLDDEALARDRAGILAEAGRAAPRAVEIKLRALGIAAPTAMAAVREAFEGADLLARAIDAAERRARSMPAGLNRATLQRRLFGYLARRGYDHDICRQAVEAALGRLEDD